MLSLLRSANRQFRRLTLSVSNISGRRPFVTSYVKFSEPLVKPNFMNENSASRLIRNSAMSALITPPEQTTLSFDYLWERILNDPNLDISSVNYYLQTRLDAGCTIDMKTVFSALTKKGLEPDARTFGVFIHQSCLQGDMEETKNILVALKNAHLEVDSYIFSCILMGYLKAGHLNEVEATKNIMNNFGLWPSRAGYFGLLSAYAKLGDLNGFTATLNEASEFFASNRDLPPLVCTVGPLSSVRLLVSLAIGLPDSDENCAEVFRFLQPRVDYLPTWSVKTGVAQLLVNRRPIAALQLFRRLNSSDLSDSYLGLLGKAINKADLDPQLMTTFMHIAKVPTARRNLIHRMVALGDRRIQVPSDKWSLQDKTVDEMLAHAADIPVNHLIAAVVPELLKRGLSPMQITQSIQPDDLAPSAALGCVLWYAAPSGDVPLSTERLQAARELAEKFCNAGCLPRRDNLQPILNRCSHLYRSLTRNEQASISDMRSLMSELFDLLTVCIGVRSDRAIGLRILSHLYHRTCFRNSRALDAPESVVLNALIDHLLEKEVHLYEDSWALYAFERLGVPSEKIKQFQIAVISDDKVDVILNQLEGLLQKDQAKA